MLTRIVYTNKLLHKTKLSDTSLCTFCGEYEESLEHLFLHCQFSKNFWMQIVSWLNDFDITIIELKDSEIMLLTIGSIYTGLGDFVKLGLHFATV